MPEQRVINKLIRTQRACSERGKSQSNGLVSSRALHSFRASPRLARRGPVMQAILAKRLQRREARGNGCFRRLQCL